MNGEEREEKPAGQVLCHSTKILAEPIISEPSHDNTSDPVMVTAPCLIRKIKISCDLYMLQELIAFQVAGPAGFSSPVYFRPVYFRPVYFHPWNWLAMGSYYGLTIEWGSRVPSFSHLQASTPHFCVLPSNWVFLELSLLYARVQESTHL